MQRKDLDSSPADAGTEEKDKDDKKVVQCTVQRRRLVIPQIGRKICHAAAEIADAHRAGISIAVPFTECLYLHGTGK